MIIPPNMENQKLTLRGCLGLIVLPCVFCLDFGWLFSSTCVLSFQQQMKAPD